MANIAQTVNVLQAMVLTDGDALVLTPTYHVFEMNKGHQDATSLPVHLRADGARRPVGDTELETVSVSASVKDGTVLVSLSNLDADRSAEVTLDLRGGRIGEARARILTADRLQAHNTPQTPEAVAPRAFDGDGVRALDRGLGLTLPPHSFVTVRAPLTVEG
jgi:alpha-N-arabinofuranosidase